MLVLCLDSTKSSDSIIYRELMHPQNSLCKIWNHLSVPSVLKLADLPEESNARGREVIHYCSNCAYQKEYYVRGYHTGNQFASSTSVAADLLAGPLYSRWGS